ncbi:MAG TPA: hypothetical protein VFX46_08660 [Hyphomicrobiaceae bacterium]|nr:hypothetical protein [Hyphomicrobiaceae bacterium]
MEYVNGQFFRGLRIVGDPHNEREDDPVQLAVQSLQGAVVSLGDPLQESRPLAFWD